MTENNPLSFSKKKSLKIGRRIGSVKSNQKYINISTSLKENHHKKINGAISNSGTITRKKIINDCLDKCLDEILNYIK